MRLIVIARGGIVRASIRAQLATARLATLTLALAAFAGVGVFADDSARANGIRPQDEIVLVNVRPVGGCCDPASLASGTQFETYQALDDSGGRQWQSTNLAGVTSGDASVSTVIFVHGNRLTNWDAKHAKGWPRIAASCGMPMPRRFGS